MVGGAFPIVKYIGATQITLHTSFVKRWWQSPKLSDFNNPEISLFSGISGDEADWDLVAACCLIFSTFIFVCDIFWGHELILDLPQTMLKVGASCSPGVSHIQWLQNIALTVPFDLLNPRIHIPAGCMLGIWMRLKHVLRSACNGILKQVLYWDCCQRSWGFDCWLRCYLRACGQVKVLRWSVTNVIMEQEIKV